MLRVLCAACCTLSLGAADLTEADAKRLVKSSEQATLADVHARITTAAAASGPFATMTLVQLGVDRRRELRLACADALADPARAVDGFIDKMLVFKLPPTRVAGLELAARVRGPAGVPAINRLAGDREARVRRAVAECLGGLPWPTPADPAASATPAPPAVAAMAPRVATLVKLLMDTEPAVAAAALDALAPALRDHAKGRDAVLTRLVDGGEDLAMRAVDALLAADPATATTLTLGLVKAMGATRLTHEQRCLAADLLGRVGGVEAIAPLLQALAAAKGARAGELRAAVADALGVIAPTDDSLAAQVTTALLPVVTDTWPGARWAAAWALMRLGSVEVVPAAIAALTKRPDEVLADLLRRYTGQTHTTADAWAAWWRASGAQWSGSRIPMSDDQGSSVTFYDLSDDTANVCFVIDTSGSMAQMMPMERAGAPARGTLFEAASAELWRAVSQLPPGTRFSVIYFDDRVQPWIDTPVRASWRNKARLRDDLATRGPGGQTNTLDALVTAIDMPGAVSIYLLSDGAPSVGDVVEVEPLAREIVTEAQDRAVVPRIHTVAFHVDPKESDDAIAFLKRLSTDTKGGHRVVK
jgi:hypothetical protein